jgi:hypothetical protein
MHGEKPQKRNWQDIPRPDAVRNLDAPIKFDSTTFSLRLPFVGEEAITKHMCRFPPFLRLATLHCFFSFLIRATATGTFIQSYRMDDTADVYTDVRTEKARRK